MGDKDEKKSGGVPPAVGKGFALLAGGIIGDKGGKELAHVISENLDLSNEAANITETGLEMGGAILGAFAAFQLAKKEPNKSVLVGFAAFGGLGAAAAGKELLEKMEEIGEKVNEIQATEQDQIYLQGEHKTEQSETSDPLQSDTMQNDPTEDLFLSGQSDQAANVMHDISPDMVSAPAEHSADIYGNSALYDQPRGHDIWGRHSDIDIYGESKIDIWGRQEGIDIHGHTSAENSADIWGNSANSHDQVHGHDIWGRHSDIDIYGESKIDIHSSPEDTNIHGPIDHEFSNLSGSDITYNDDLSTDTSVDI